MRSVRARLEGLITPSAEPPKQLIDPALGDPVRLSDLAGTPALQQHGVDHIASHPHTGTTFPRVSGIYRDISPPSGGTTDHRSPSLKGLHLGRFAHPPADPRPLNWVHLGSNFHFNNPRGGRETAGARSDQAPG